MKKSRFRAVLPACAIVAALLAAVRAEAPHVYAITGARIVTAAGPPIESGVVVVRGGVIESVGPSATAPRDAVVFDGRGLTVYPGLIDMGNSAGLSVPAVELPREPRTRMESERARRELLLRPQIETADCVKADAPELRRLASAGITSVLATPPGDLFEGRSSLLATAIPDDEPQIGNIADRRRGLHVVRTPVALHVSFPLREGGGTYPASLMGAVAFVRQAFLDAGHYRMAAQRASEKRAAPRPAHDPALEALQPALTGKLPVAFRANTAVEIRRALALARELGLAPIITGALDSDQVHAELKAQGARVIFSLEYPVRPRSLSPDADEPIAVLRRRAGAPRVPLALARGGVLFAFESRGLADARDFLRNAAKAVAAGLPADAAVRALTIDAATIAGVDSRLGSIEPGKAANLLVTDGDLFAERTSVKHVFVDGRPVVLDVPEVAAPRRRGP